MNSNKSRLIGIVSVVLLLTSFPAHATDEQQPTIAVTEDMAGAMVREATEVGKEFKKQAKSLFERKPLGWNIGTVEHVYSEGVSLPLKIPTLTREVIQQSRLLGVVGSLLVLLFVLVVLYSLLGQTRVLRWVEKQVRPLGERIPHRYYPYFLSTLKVVVSALIPLVLLGLFSLINEMIAYQATWFNLTGQLLGLWAVGALILRLLKETLTRDLFKTTVKYGKPVFRYARLIVIYVLIGVAMYWAGHAFRVRQDVLALLQFVLSASIVTLLFLFFLKRSAFLSLFPDVPSIIYQRFLGFLNACYYPLLIISFLAALLWCFGYRVLGPLVLAKIWFNVGAFLVIILVYHSISNWLGNWSQQSDHAGETAQFLARSLKSLLLYASVLLTLILVLSLLGLLDPLRRIISFPMFQFGETAVTLWIILKAVVILLAFVFASRLLQAYLDFKVYPILGVDPGLGYALNTFFKYLLLAGGILISIEMIGIDLRFLIVFAGAAGIGIGLGLQNMAANIISGFSIIFGGKIRKGDWIEVSETLGVVTDIFMRATKVRTRDNIEYLIPNSDLISGIVVNYSLSSPMIRVELPVGVSYNADPAEVEKILLDVAGKEPLVSDYQKPAVRFVEFADSSLNFELLFWIDIREVPRRKVRSALYFAVFQEFKKAGIEIPFPQRDIHLRNG